MSDEHTVAIVSEHGAIVRMVDRVRRKFQQANQPYLQLDISVSGRVDSRPIMSYKVRCEQYGEAVEGNDLDEVVREVLRRKGWKEHNKPLELTFESNGDTPTKVNNDDDIQF